MFKKRLNWGSVEILNLMQIISTTFLSMLYTMSLSLISFTWLRNFLALCVSPNVLFTTVNVISVIFLWLYLILSKTRCNCFYIFSRFFLFLCFKCIIESAFISSLIRAWIFSESYSLSNNIRPSDPIWSFYQSICMFEFMVYFLTDFPS